MGKIIKFEDVRAGMRLVRLGEPTNAAPARVIMAKYVGGNLLVQYGDLEPLLMSKETFQKDGYVLAEDHEPPQPGIVGTKVDAITTDEDYEGPKQITEDPRRRNIVSIAYTPHGYLTAFCDDDTFWTHHQGKWLITEIPPIPQD